MPSSILHARSEQNKHDFMYYMFIYQEKNYKLLLKTLLFLAAGFRHYDGLHPVSAKSKIVAAA